MNNSSKTVGLMIEIILSIVFFSIICTVVLQLLLHAQKMEQYSRDKSGAVALAQSIGDIFRSRMSDTPQDFDSIMSLRYGEALVREDQGYTIHLDERMIPREPAWQTDSKKDIPCFARIVLEDVKNISTGTVSRAFIQVEKQGTTLFELSVDRYRPQEP